MVDFEVIGWSLPTMRASVEKGLLLLRHLAAESDTLCLEAHFHDLDGVKRLAEVVPSGRFAAYCWSDLDDYRDLQREELLKVYDASMAFGNVSIRLEYGHGFLPPYDWDGRAPERTTVRIACAYPKPLLEEHREPSHGILQLCADAASEVVALDFHEPVKTVTEWADGGRIHNYLLSVPRAKGIAVAASICAKLELKNGHGSYELLGTPAEFEEIHRGGCLEFGHFPADAWSRNEPVNTPYALARQSYVCPVPNVDAGSLSAAASVIDSLGDQVAHCNVVRKYLAWNLGGVRFSPRTKDNYFLVSRQKVGYAMFVGFEQYADADPPARLFMAAATPVIERLGARLKRVSNIR